VPASSLTVQVVLFETPVVDVIRQLAGLAAAAEVALRSGSLRRVRILYGDSSPTPALDADALAVLGAEAAAGDLAPPEYHFFDANLGSGGGSNRLASLGSDPLFLVLNPDTQPDTRLLVELAAALEDPRVAAADARQIPVEHPKAFDLVTGDTGWVSGAAMIVRRAAFEQVGGFAAEHLPMYCDDVDLSWRLRLAGWRVVHEPRALVFHDKRIDPDGGVIPTPTQTKMSAMAGLVMARRWDQPEVLHHLLQFFEAQSDGPYREVYEAWRQQEAAGRLPAPLANAHRVARFVDGGYDAHRY